MSKRKKPQPRSQQQPAPAPAPSNSSLAIAKKHWQKIAAALTIGVGYGAYDTFVNTPENPPTKQKSDFDQFKSQYIELGDVSVPTVQADVDNAYAVLLKYMEKQKEAPEHIKFTLLGDNHIQRDSLASMMAGQDISQLIQLNNATSIELDQQSLERLKRDVAESFKEMTQILGPTAKPFVAKLSDNTTSKELAQRITVAAFFALMHAIKREQGDKPIENPIFLVADALIMKRELLAGDPLHQNRNLLLSEEREMAMADALNKQPASAFCSFGFVHLPKILGLLDKTRNTQAINGANSYLHEGIDDAAKDPVFLFGFNRQQELEKMNIPHVIVHGKEPAALDAAMMVMRTAIEQRKARNLIPEGDAKVLHELINGLTKKIESTLAVQQPVGRIR